MCTSPDKEVCVKCKEPFSEKEVENRESLENDELVHCASCDQWWHQACHVPALYPLPIGEFRCSDCSRAPIQPAPSSRSSVRQVQQRRRQAQPAPAADRERRKTATYTPGHNSFLRETDQGQPTWQQLHGADASSTTNGRLTHDRL